MLNLFIESLKPNWLRDLQRSIRNHHWEETDEGLLISGNEVRGDLIVTADDGLGARHERNLLTTEGKNLILSTILGSTAKIATWYVAPASGNVTYSASWTGANFTANATELTTEYAESTRVEYVEGTAAAGAISNSASPAVFTSASVSPVSIWGCGLSSASAKSAVIGSLLAASKYTTVRTLAEAGDKLSVAWTITLT